MQKREYVNNKKLLSLFTKLKLGTPSAEERLRLQEYFEAGKPDDLLNLIHAELELENPDELLPESPAEQQVFNRVYSRITELRFFEDNKPVKQIRLWSRIAGVAAAVAVIVFGIWFYNTRHFEGSKAGSDHLNYTNDIKPGKNSARITLGNGKIINLSNAKSGVVIDAGSLSYNDGSSTGAPSFGAKEQLTVSTPRGGTYQVTLSDGTRVWLNAASSLTYAAGLNEHGERRVRLDGEGYFEVAKDKNHPFIVSSNKQEVKVLGTHFNIHSYADEPSVTTTLLEGSVRVSDVAARNEVILIPNQQASITGNSGINLKEVNAENIIAWKNGLFMFNDEPLTAVMQKISRWYGVEVHFTDPGLSGKTVYGTISRYSNVSKVLKMLEKTGEMQFEITGNVINVKRK